MWFPVCGCWYTYFYDINNNWKQIFLIVIVRHLSFFVVIFLPILHCQCYTDCRIDGNKIRVLEEDWDKCGGYNLPVVQMNNNEPDIFASEAMIIGDVPKGKRAGDKIKLIIDGYNGAIGPSGKTLTATYTYEWREWRKKY